MAERLVPVLTARQEAILARVVEAYVATGAPVGSKTLVEQGAIDVSSSTVRNDLAVLEELGLLMHPHTSAGRVPTEQGYRFYADRLLERLDAEAGRAPARPLGRAEPGRGGAPDDHRGALGGHAPARPRLGSEARDDDRPPRGGAVTPAGARDGRRDHVDRRGHEAARRVHRPGRPGTRRVGRRVPERVRGRAPARRPPDQSSLRGAGARPARAHLPRCDPAGVRRTSSSPTSRRSSWAGRRGSWTSSGPTTSAPTGGCSRCSSSAPRCSGSCRRTYSRRDRSSASAPTSRIRSSRPSRSSARRTVSSTGTSGTVSLLGPTRMDYVKAIDAVRYAARELSRFVEEMYEE